MRSWSLLASLLAGLVVTTVGLGDDAPPRTVRDEDTNRVFYFDLPLPVRFLALESDSLELPHWQDIIRHDGPICRDGYFELPNKPGLGIELDEDVCRKHLADGSGFFE